ncbi:MAG: tetratricopeptide repeat protein [Clostridiales bacterium]|nr:tetratricopeptide repeat protein [Clostridiales bacterium]
MSKNMNYCEYTDGCGAGTDMLTSAEYALETGDLDSVATHCRKAIAKAEKFSQTGVILCAKFALIRLHLAQGNTIAALQLLSKMELKVETLNSSEFNTTVDLCKGYVFACLSQPEQIPA